MNKKIAKLWTTALRSKKYKQGQLRLNTPYNGSYCCLGVLCEVMISEGNHLVKRSEDDSTTFDEEEFGLPHSVAEWSGMHSPVGTFTDINGYITSLVIKNDQDLLTFDEIADLIDEYVDSL